MSVVHVAIGEDIHDTTTLPTYIASQSNEISVGSVEAELDTSTLNQGSQEMSTDKQYCQ
jgi:hypothetical protein